MILRFEAIPCGKVEQVLKIGYICIIVSERTESIIRMLRFVQNHTDGFDVYNFAGFFAKE